MPTRDKTSGLGERLSGLEATVAGMDRYAHEKWHDLNNSLQPLVALPERLTRDIAKMHGTFDGKLGAATKELERSITAAVEKAVQPLTDDISKLKTDVEELQQFKNQQTGAKNLAVAFLHSPVVAWLFAIAVAVWTYFKGNGR